MACVSLSTQRDQTTRRNGAGTHGSDLPRCRCRAPCGARGPRAPRRPRPSTPPSICGCALRARSPPTPRTGAARPRPPRPPPTLPAGGSGTGCPGRRRLAYLSRRCAGCRVRARRPRIGRTARGEWRRCGTGCFCPASARPRATLPAPRPAGPSCA
eukprot:3398080-Rhodomonas_salina.4